MIILGKQQILYLLQSLTSCILHLAQKAFYKNCKDNLSPNKIMRIVKSVHKRSCKNAVT